jgi:ABC-2 type transport system ATP-binding protein
VVAPALVVDGVRVTFGFSRALDDVSFSLDVGHTLAVLGHNGAGKTTLVGVLTTLIVPDRGRVLVDGIDVLARPAEVRRRVGVTGQYAALNHFLTTVENLELMCRLSGLRRAARGRAQELIGRFELEAVATRLVGEYLEEADRLADQVLFLGHGRVVGHGTPSELKALVGTKVLRATLPADAVDALSQRPDTTTPAGPNQLVASFSLSEPGAATKLLGRLTTDAIEITDLEVASPSLEDVFFQLAMSEASR